VCVLLQVFDQAFNLQRGQIDEAVISKCGQLLHAFMLRRLKRDVLATLPSKTEALVYVPMSKTQIELSRQLLLSGGEVLGALAKATSEGKEGGAAAEKDWTQVQSLLLSLRKCCNHPQLFGSWMGEISENIGEDLATSSGKLATLGLLLDNLLPAGHRVVLFSGWTSMLDIIEKYMQSKSIEYCRLDGSTNRVQRQIDIKKFNQVTAQQQQKQQQQQQRRRQQHSRPLSSPILLTPPASSHLHRSRARPSPSSSAQHARAASALRSPPPTQSCCTTRTSTRRSTCRRWTASTASARTRRCACYG